MNKKFGKKVAKTMRDELRKKGPEGVWFKKSEDHPDIKAESIHNYNTLQISCFLRTRKIQSNSCFVHASFNIFPGSHDLQMLGS